MTFTDLNIVQQVAVAGSLTGLHVNLSTSHHHFPFHNDSEQKSLTKYGIDLPDNQLYHAHSVNILVTEKTPHNAYPKSIISIYTGPDNKANVSINESLVFRKSPENVEDKFNLMGTITIGLDLETELYTLFNYLGTILPVVKGEDTKVLSTLESLIEGVTKAKELPETAFDTILSRTLSPISYWSTLVRLLNTGDVPYYDDEGGFAGAPDIYCMQTGRNKIECKFNRNSNPDSGYSLTFEGDSTNGSNLKLNGYVSYLGSEPKLVKTVSVEDVETKEDFTDSLVTVIDDLFTEYEEIKKVEPLVTYLKGAITNSAGFIK